MTSDEFREAAGRATDWVVGYLEHIRDYPVLSPVRPGELIKQLPAAAPETGESMETILADFEKLIVPGVTHWNHPRFFAYFANSGPPPGIVAEMLAAALNVNGMLWRSSPAATELEQVTLGWLRRWLGLPEDWFGLVYDTASTAVLHALVAAREFAEPAARASGSPPGLVAYCSDQAHSSVEKAAITAGLGQASVRKIASDEEFRMRVDALEQAIAADRAAGLRPFCLVATVGTTAVAAVDPVPALAEVARREGLWFHVDAAYGGSFAVLEEMRHLLAGCEHADSFVMNPHKALLTQFDFSVFFTRRPEVLHRAFSLVPEFLRTAPGETNLMDYGVPLGRRFRALKFWFILRSYGRAGVSAVLREQLRCAREFAEWVRQDSRFELCAAPQFTLVCFRLRGGTEENRRLLERVNNSGVAFLSHTILEGRFVLRLAVGNYQTTIDDLRLVWREIRCGL